MWGVEVDVEVRILIGAEHRVGVLGLVVHILYAIMLMLIFIFITSLLSHKNSILLVGSLLLVESCLLNMNCLLLSVISLTWNELFLQPSRYS